MRWQTPECDSEGRTTIPGYWDLEEIRFREIEMADQSLRLNKDEWMRLAPIVDMLVKGVRECSE